MLCGTMTGRILRLKERANDGRTKDDLRKSERTRTLRLDQLALVCTWVRALSFAAARQHLRHYETRHHSWGEEFPPQDERGLHALLSSRSTNRLGRVRRHLSRVQSSRSLRCP